MGYGDINAVTLEEKLFATFWMIGGFTFYSYTIGSFQSILNEIDSSAYALQLKLDMIHAFSKRTRLPVDL